MPQSPDTNVEAETILEEITNSLEGLTLRNITNLNPHSHNTSWSKMSGEMVIPPTGGTFATSSNVVNPSSTSGTMAGSGTSSRTTSKKFSNPSDGPFLYGMPLISGPYNAFGLSQ